MAEAVRPRPKTKKNKTKRKEGVNLPALVIEPQAVSDEECLPVADICEENQIQENKIVKDDVQSEEKDTTATSDESKTDCEQPVEKTDKIEHDQNVIEEEKSNHSQHATSEIPNSAEEMSLQSGQKGQNKEDGAKGDIEKEILSPSSVEEDYVSCSDIHDISPVTDVKDIVSESVGENHEQHVNEMGEMSDKGTAVVTEVCVESEKEEGISVNEVQPSAPIAEERIEPTAPKEDTRVRIEAEVVEKAKARIAHRKLYPELPKSIPERLKPFTNEQLRSLYSNQQLDAREKIVDEFLKVVVEDKCEFYELVLNYYRARNHLASTEQDVESLRKDYDRYMEMVWKDVEHSQTVVGQCEDKYKVTKEHKYIQAYFDPESCTNAGITLKSIRNLTHDDLSLHAYAAQLSRLQVESYLHSFYSEHPALKDLPPNVPVQAYMHKANDPSQNHGVEQLRQCITVLFMFQRRPAKDDMFKKDTREWLRRLVATLLRVATIEDHIFILNHVMRCPAGVGKWAADFIQPVPPPCAVGQQSWSHPLLDHFLNMLAMILFPVKMREQLLTQLKIVMTPCADKANDNPWILVDSDGEEDEDPANSWQYLLENDVVGFLDQLPISIVFQHVLHIQEIEGHAIYNIHHESDPGMLRLFAFLSCLIKLLGEGLKTYTIGRYRQLNKRLGRLVRHVMLYGSDHWHNFKNSYPNLPAATMDRLSVEFDQMFFRATQCILNAQRLGSWQFMADMPYKGISLDMMWRLVWLMHQWNRDEADQLESIPVAECIQTMKDQDSRLVFEDKLLSMPTSEAIYLLTTFANMARSRPETDKEFVEVVTGEIYEIAYISNHTREFCSKVGRELLMSIAQKHPYTISSLLQRVCESMDQIGMMSLYLFTELPVCLWQPTEIDFGILKDWLLEKSLTSPESQLARLVIQKMNWAYNSQAVSLFLDIALHQRMAVLLVEAYNAHISEKQASSMLSDSLKRVASALKSQMTNEQQLSHWCWKLALTLHLHASQQPKAVLGSPADISPIPYNVMDIENEPSFFPMVQEVKKKGPLAAYLALVIGKWSHSTTDFCAEGIDMLSILVEHHQYTATVRVLSFVTPSFYHCKHYLLENQKFMELIGNIINSDLAKKGYLYSEFPGPATELMTLMILDQIQKCSIPGGENLVTVTEFWMRIICKLPNWHQDKSLLYVLDNMLMTVHRYPQAEEKAHDIIKEFHQEYVKNVKEPGMLSSLVPWLASANTLPSLIETSACPQFAWYAYAVLNAETWYENEINLWPSLQKELFADSAISIEPAMKKVVTSLKLTASPPPQRLCIYRWAQQAVEMDMNQPLLPYVWQRFFLLYLGRLAADPGLPQRGSVGEKFFDTSSNLTMMKKLKKHLTATANQHHKSRRKNTEPSSGNTSTGDSDSAASADEGAGGLVDSSGHQSNRQFHKKLVKFYQTLSFWLDEPRLHDPNLYLPALPAQYEPERLLGLFQNQLNPWTEFVDFDRIDKALQEFTQQWSTHVVNVNHSAASHRRNSLNGGEEAISATQNVLNRLKRVDPPKPPPQLQPTKAPVPEIDPLVLMNKNTLIHTLRSDMNALVEHAKLHSDRVTKHLNFDLIYVDLLPDWYKNEPTEVVVAIPCESSFNFVHRCKGPAQVQCRYETKMRNDIVNRKLIENRAGYKQIMIESVLPPAQHICSSAVHVENVITALVKMAKASKSSAEKQAAIEAGTCLFFYLSSFVSEETKYYPPTKQFFSFCIEIMGQEFIRNNPTQAQPLLQCILKSPTMVGLLAPNFCPNSNPDLFVTMYEDMLQVPNNQGPEVAFTLFTKFDVSGWLESCKPPLSQRSNLIAVIGQALIICGRDTPHELRLMFALYRSHLQIVLAYKFPDHYGDVLKLMLKESSTESINPVCWEDFLESLGVVEPKKKVHIERLVSPEISLSHIKETMEWMSSYFFRIRVSNADRASFGLYPKWKIYNSSVATFLEYLSVNYVQKVSLMVKGGSKDASQALLEVWKTVKEVFAPWVQPLDNNGQILSPWIEGDSELAMQMVACFTTSILTIQQQFEGLLAESSPGVLSLFWQYYVTDLSRAGTADHVVKVYQAQFVQLSWDKYKPQMDDIDTMMKLPETHQKAALKFLSEIFPLMKWPEIIQMYCNTQSLEVVARLHVCFFHLLIYMSKNADVLQKPEFQQLLTHAESFNWDFLDARSYGTTVSWYTDNCDPESILADRTSPEAHPIKVMKLAARFYSFTEPVLHPETPAKRVAYVRCVVQLFCKSSHVKTWSSDLCSINLMNLATEIETVVGSVMDLGMQQEQSVALCTQLLNILNNCNPQGKSREVLEKTLMQWIESSSSSILLLPLVTAACRALASIDYMVKVIETCMDAYFLSCPVARESWIPMLSVLAVPELSHNEFLEEAVKYNCYLTLYAYVVQRLPKSNSLEDEMDILKKIVNWTGNIKPCADNEAKLFLLWDKVFELSLRQVDFGTEVWKVSRVLHNLIPVLVTLGEDKASTGLLGAIGLGKRSSLSLRFRTIVKCVVVYLYAQMPSNSSIRTQPYSPGTICNGSVGSPPSPGGVQPTPQALQSLSQLESLKTNKQYVSLSQHIDLAIQFVSNPANSLREMHTLILHLTKGLYPDKLYMGLLNIYT